MAYIHLLVIIGTDGTAVNVWYMQIIFGIIYTQQNYYQIQLLICLLHVYFWFIYQLFDIHVVYHKCISFDKFQSRLLGQPQPQIYVAVALNTSPYTCTLLVMGLYKKCLCIICSCICSSNMWPYVDCFLQMWQYYLVPVFRRKVLYMIRAGHVLSIRANGLSTWLDVYYHDYIQSADMPLKHPHATADQI